MSKIIAVANQKGGVAKTTTVASIGAAVAELGRSVLLVDLDPQACLTFSLGIDPESLSFSMHDVMVGRVSPRTVLQTTKDGADLLPACIEMAGADVVLAPRTGREFVLRTALEEVAGDYQIVLLDCPPSLGVMTVNALTAAHEVLVPLQCETLSHRGVGQLLDTVQEVQRITNNRLRVRGILPTLFDGRTTHAKAVLHDIQARYGLPVLEPPIPKSIRFAEAPAAGQTILGTAGRTPGARAYRAHARALLGLPPEEDDE